MEFYQLQYFMYVAKYENITKAAHELRVGQPAVSKAVKALEGELQVQLLQRNGKKIQLTREGRLLATRALPLLSNLEAVKEELKLFGENREVIKLNILSCNSLLADIIRKFKELEPGVMFIITEQSEKADWDLGSRSAATEVQYTNGIRILEEKICLASKKGTWLDERDTISLGELKRERFIVLRRGAQLRNMAEAKFHEARVVPDISFECDTLYIVQQLTEQGLGITFWPEYSWGKSDKVKLTPIEEDMRRAVYLLHQSDHKSSQAVLRFSIFIQEYIKGMI